MFYCIFLFIYSAPLWNVNKKVENSGNICKLYFPLQIQQDTDSFLTANYRET